jgi:hypothetical protein
MREAKAVQPSSTPERRVWTKDADRRCERGPDDLVPRARPAEKVLVPCGERPQEFRSAALVGRSRCAGSVDLLLEREYQGSIHGTASTLGPVLPVPACKQLERRCLELADRL